MGIRTARLVATLATSLLAGWPVAAAAQEAEAAPAEQSGRKDDARRFFTAARKAFDEGRYEDAARAFEEAARLKPHPAPIINAGDAWQKAGEYALAARAFQRVLKMKQASEQDRIDATDRLAQLQPKLGVVELMGADTIRAKVGDEEFRGGDRIYVFPGEYVVTLVDVDGAKTRTLSVKAGTARTVDLDSLRPAKPASGGATSSSQTSGGDGGDSKPGGISTTTWLAYGIGALGVAGTVVFGFGVNSAEKDFNTAIDDKDQDGAQDAFDRFEQNKLLTNVSLAVGVVGVGLGTFFLVSDLGRDPSGDSARRRPLGGRTDVGIAPAPGGGMLVTRGRF